MRAPTFLFMAGLVVAAAVPGPAESQALITGRVLHEATDAPVPGATVELLTSRDELVRRTATDDGGRFLLLIAREGRYRLRATRIGLSDGLSAPIDVAPGDTVRVILRMDIQAVQLPALEVVTHSRAPAIGRMVGFHERARLGFGSFIHRAEIELRNPLQISHMIAERGWDLQTTSKASHPWSVGIMSRRYNCTPTIYLDGIRIHTGGGDDEDAVAASGEALGMIHPQDVVGIELYHGTSTVPPEFHTADSRAMRCGVIAIWTGPP